MLNTKSALILCGINLALLNSGQASATCPNEPVAQATSGYGANGAYSSAYTSFRNPEKWTQKVYVYYPVGGTPAPTVFFSHGFGARNPSEFIDMIEHLNSRGYTVVYPQYPTFGGVAEKYDILWEGFQEAADRHAAYIDTTQVAFVGQSFGGGATPRMTLNGLGEGWGGSGVAMYIMAPWYSFNLSNSDLTGFDTSVKMNVVVFDEDGTNDHEMAIDVFENIAIPAAGKAFYRVYSDSEGDCNFDAVHSTPNSQVLNGLDYWNWYHLDALLDYTFTGNTAAQTITLGGGSSEQTYWGTWWTNTDYTPAQVTADPLPSNTSPFYTFKCDDSDNPRSGECNWPTPN